MAPPLWLRRWRRIAVQVCAFVHLCQETVANLVVLTAFPVFQMLTARIMPQMGQVCQRYANITGNSEPSKEWENPTRCDHADVTGKSAVKRYGNKYGRYGHCQRCDRKWKWNEAQKRWDIVTDTGSSRSSGSSSRLVPPSSVDTTQAPPPRTSPGPVQAPRPKQRAQQDVPHFDLTTEEPLEPPPDPDDEMSTAWDREDWDGCEEDL